MCGMVREFIFDGRKTKRKISQLIFWNWNPHTHTQPRREAHRYKTDRRARTLTDWWFGMQRIKFNDITIDLNNNNRNKAHSNTGEKEQQKQKQPIPIIIIKAPPSPTTTTPTTRRKETKQITKAKISQTARERQEKNQLSHIQSHSIHHLNAIWLLQIKNEAEKKSEQNRFRSPRTYSHRIYYSSISAAHTHIYINNHSEGLEKIYEPAKTYTTYLDILRKIPQIILLAWDWGKTRTKANYISDLLKVVCGVCFLCCRFYCWKRGNRGNRKSFSTG